MSLLHSVPGYVHLDGPLAALSDMHEKMANEKINTTFETWCIGESPLRIQVIHAPNTEQYSFMAQVAGMPTITENGVATKHYDFLIHPTLNLGYLSVTSFEKGIELCEADHLAAAQFQYKIQGLLLPDESDVAHFASVVGDYQDHLVESGH